MLMFWSLRLEYRCWKLIDTRVLNKSILLSSKDIRNHWISTGRISGSQDLRLVRSRQGGSPFPLHSSPLTPVVELRQCRP